MTMASVALTSLLPLLLWSAVSVDGQAQEEGQTPALRPEEMYQDMFPLTNDNFTSSVLRIKDPWVVIFHSGSVDRNWKTMATQTRGLIWIGLVDVIKERALVEHLEYDNSRGVARVYPFGTRLQKERNFRHVSTENEARQIGLRSLPDRVHEIDANDLHDVFTDSFMSRPSRFPAFLFLETEETPSTFKALSLRFEKYFMFSKIVQPSIDDLHALGLEKTKLELPELFVIVTTDGKLDDVHAIRFDIEKFGHMNYTQVMEFLFTVNSRFRHELAGVNYAHAQQEAEMADVVQIEARRFEIIYGEDGAKHVKLPPPESAQQQDSKFRLKVTKTTGFRDEL